MGGYVNFTSNTSLTSINISSLPAIKASGLTFTSNGSVATGALAFNLNGLTSITGGVVVTSNPTLQLQSGFASLALIQGALTIQSNTALASLNALSALTGVTGAFTVTSNPALPTCSVTGVRTLITNPAPTGTTISANLADTCGS